MTRRKSGHGIRARRSILIAALMAAPLSAAAQNVLNPGAGGTFSWSTATWSLGTPSLFGGATQVLQFSNPGSVSYLALNDLGSQFYLNSIQFNSPGGSARVGSAPANGLLLINNGATNPTIQQLGAGSANISSGMTLASPTTISGLGTGELSLTGVLRGAQTLTINRSGGQTVLGGANTYTGGTTLSAGLVKLGDETALGSGVLVINGGTLRTDTSFSGLNIANSITLNSALNYDSTSGPVLFGANFAGVLSGAGGLNHSGTNTIVQLGGANTYTGATTVSNGATLRINSAANIAGTATINLNNGTLSVAQLATGSVSITKPIILGAGGGTIGAFEQVLQTEVLTAAGAISGTGQLTKINNGMLFLSGSNTYTGGTRIETGAVVISADSALGSGSITFGFNDGMLVSNASTISKTINLGTARATINANSATTISGLIQGAGAGLVKAGNSTLTLTAANTQIAPVTVASGTLLLNGVSGRINDPSVVSADPYLTGRPGSVIDLDNAAGNANRIADGTHVQLIGSSLILRGNAGANTNESIASLSFSGAGANTVTVIPGSGRNASITSARWLRAPAEGSTAIFRGTALGSTPGANVGNILFQFVNSGSLVGGAGAAGTTTISILPWAVGDTSTTGSGSSLVTYDATNGIRPLNTATEYRTTLGVNAADNVRVTTALTLPASSSTTANGLLVGPGGSINLNGGTLNLTASIILAAGGANTGITGGTINFGPTNNATIHTANDLTINAIVTGSQGVSKAGPGTLRLNNTNTYSGATRVLEGTLRNNTGFNSIPDSSMVVVNSGATFDISDTNETIGRLTTLNASNAFAAGNYGTVALGTRTLFAGGAAGANDIDFFNGEMTGTGGFTKQGPGTQVFSGTQSYSGQTNIQSGTLILQSGNGTRSGAGLTSTSEVRIGGGVGTAALNIGFGVTSFDRPLNSLTGSTTNVLFAGGTCAFGGAVTLGKDLRVVSANGGVGLNGLISGGAGLILQSGNLTIGNALNTYTGDTTILAGRVSVGANVPDGAAGPLGNASQPILVGNTFSTDTVDSELAIGNSAVAISRFITTRADSNPNAGAALISNRAASGTGAVSGNVTLNRAVNGLFSDKGAVLRVTGPILGSGGQLQIGRGFRNSNVVMSGNGTFGGLVFLQSGQLGIGTNTVMSGPTVLSGPVGTSVLVIGGSSLEGSATPALYADGGERNLGNTISMTSDLRVTGANDLTLSGAVSLGGSTRTIDVSNTGATTISGAISGGASGLVKEGAGQLILSGANTYTGTTAVFTGTLAFGASQSLSKLRIGDGAVAQFNTGANKVLQMTSLDIANSGRLNLTDNDAVINYTGTSPIATIAGKLTQAYNGGSWTGNGFTSTSAAAAASTSLRTALGFAEATDIFTSFPANFSGVLVDNTSVLVRYTASGDATLDGMVNGSDFNILATNFGTSGKRWSQGDFTYDMLVNSSDFNSLAANFGQTVAGNSNQSRPGANVPEPAISCLVAMAGMFLARRTRFTTRSTHDLPR